MEIRPDIEGPLLRAVKYLLETFDAAAARQAFVIQRYLRQTGQQIRRTDPLIAAQAITMGAVCVTDNLQHFLRIPGLIVENWLQPE